MDANGLAFTLTAIILTLLGVYKGYPRLAARVSGINADSAEEKPTIENLNARIKELEAKVTAAQQERDKAHEESGKLQEQLETRINDLQSQINDLKTQNNKITAEATRVTKERDDALEENRKLLKRIAEHQETIISMGDSNHAMEKDIQELKIANAAAHKVDDIVIALSKGIGDAVRDGIKAALSTGELAKIVLKEAAP